VERGAAEQRKQQNQPPTVTVLGDVRQNVIVWSNGLTLAQAITTAQYARRQSPRAIVLRRGDEAIRLTPEFLFQGGEDPVLEPGDVIELIR
jgi:protein involved in polysaccharide export with SLBB domain